MRLLLPEVLTYERSGCAKAAPPFRPSVCRLVSRLQPFAGMQHLDVAGGTGDVAFRVLDAIKAAERDEELRTGNPTTSPVIF
jgi:hypothetical protein